MSCTLIRRLGCGGCAVAMILAGSASGATLTWDGSNGNWDTDAAWLPAGIEPTAGDEVQINAGTVAVTLAEVADWVYVGHSGTGVLNIGAGGTVTNNFGFLGLNTDSIGIATVTGAGSKWTNNDTLFIGISGEGTLNVEAGGYVSNLGQGGFLGYEIGSVGTVTVTGANSKWESLSPGLIGQITIGREGTGTLNIEDGGQVSTPSTGYLGRNDGGSGTVTVTGAGSTFNGSLAVGFEGEGTLTIKDGGLVTGGGGIGTRAGATGIVTVSGVGSKLIGGVGVATGGNGTLIIEDGGRVEAAETGGGIAHFGDSIGYAKVTGSGSEWSMFGDMTVAREGTGTLLIEDRAQVSNQDGTIGSGVHNRGTGIVTVTGDGSTWTNRGEVKIGEFGGSGTLNIEDGGRVSNTIAAVGNAHGLGAGSVPTGIVTVNGAGSMWINAGTLTLGSTGTGTLNIEAGGQVTSVDGYMGRFSGSSGAATVTGAGSLWTLTGSLTVGGFDAPGTLLVSDGGRVSNTTGMLGLDAGTIDRATVTGAGSRWINSGSLTIGRSGDALLNIEAGGRVSNTDGHIGILGGSTSLATVTGAGSQWTQSGALFIGSGFGSGTLHIEAGGRVADTDGHLGTNIIGIGAATVTGVDSAWTHSGDLFVGASGVSAGGSGTLNVLSHGRVDVAGTLNIFQTAAVTLEGGVIDAATIDHTDGGVFNFLGGTLTTDAFMGDLTQNGGMLATGDSPGVTDISGNYTLNGGSLEVELAGLIQGVGYDTYHIGGDFTIAGGALSVLTLEPFVLGLNQHFDVVGVDGVLSGTFAGLTEGSIVDTFNGIDLFITYHGGDGNDITLFTAVPEPGTVGLMSLGTVVMLCRRRV